MTVKAAIEGWYTLDSFPSLIGSQCTSCKSYYFPKQVYLCRNPSCQSTALDEVMLSSKGTLWSYTDAQYQPPEPFIVNGPYQPFAIAAVQLEQEKMVILGQVGRGYSVEDLKIGMPMKMIIEPLFSAEDGPKHIWKWVPDLG